MPSITHDPDLCHDAPAGAEEVVLGVGRSIVLVDKPAEDGFAAYSTLLGGRAR
jgi:hypothetical protein